MPFIIILMTTIFISPEASYIAMCESGDTVTLYSHSWTARSATFDGGAFQFNDKTWAWVMPNASVQYANQATPREQYTAFLKLWNGGYGYRHWSASQSCWGKYFTLIDNRMVLLNTNQSNTRH